MAVITQTYIDAIHKFEGGLTSDPKDPASKYPSPCAPLKNGLPPHTSKGVTWSTFVALAPSLGYTPDCQTFISMPDNVWIKIFKHGYWDPIKLDDVNSNGVAYLLSDFSWGSGTAYPVSFLKNFLQTNYGISANDSTSQNKALNDLTAKNEQEVIDKLSAQRLASLKSMKGGTLFATYGVGWTSRLNQLTALAKSLMGKTVDEAKAAVSEAKKHPYITIAATAAVIVTLYLVFSKTKKAA